MWFEVALVATIFAIGGVIFGHFEEHKPKSRRVAKILIILLLTALITEFLGRAVFYSCLGLLSAAVIWVHAVWLPKNGVNGWTGEPRERYYELIGRRK